MISSPRRGGFITYLKGTNDEAKFTLPAFSLLETQEFGKMLGYDEARIRDAEILYGVFSGVPRFCYELAYASDQWVGFIDLFLLKELDPILKLNQRQAH